jgi:hypothetical protein
LEHLEPLQGPSRTLGWRLGRRGGWGRRADQRTG